MCRPTLKATLAIHRVAESPPAQKLSPAPVMTANVHGVIHVDVERQLG